MKSETFFMNKFLRFNASSFGHCIPAGPESSEDYFQKGTLLGQKPALNLLYIDTRSNSKKICLDIFFNHIIQLSPFSSGYLVFTFLPAIGKYSLLKKTIELCEEKYNYTYFFKKFYKPSGNSFCEFGLVSTFERFSAAF